MKNTSFLAEGIRITNELLDDIIFLCEKIMGRNKTNQKYPQEKQDYNKTT
ncbi:hypothetical protein H7E67_17905 [Clostridium gasigenes]|nr:hypothetical protein [Clostridium gasigenes]MBB6625293.1 hypothetical protein [Clostridium gasigenes]MBU3089877.1 hypothetical protein [Clostridium gasigenes]